MISNDEQHRLKTIRAERQKRLEVLELKQARQGDDTPANILVEIEEIKQAIGNIDAALSSTLSQATADELGPSGRFMALHTRLQLVEQRYNDALAMLGEKVESVEDRQADLSDTIAGYRDQAKGSGDAVMGLDLKIREIKNELKPIAGMNTDIQVLKAIQLSTDTQIRTILERLSKQSFLFIVSVACLFLFMVVILIVK